MNKQIQNWDTLTDEQKKHAERLLKEGNPGVNPTAVHPAAKFFEEHRWVKIDKFIDINMCNLLYHHIQLEAKRLNYLEEEGIETNDDLHGTFTDPQAPGDFSKYGDPIFDTLLNLSLAKMQELTGKELVPTYSYHRLYTRGTELKRHSDRPSCEISTTLCLGYDSDYNWPMYVEAKPIELEPGDIIVYKGEKLKHGRDVFEGKNHAQCFLHYNDKNGPFKETNKYDTRPHLGLPPEFNTKADLFHTEEYD